MVNQPRQCPTYGKTCSGCVKPNHFCGLCKSVQRYNKQVNINMSMGSSPNTTIDQLSQKQKYNVIRNVQ